MGEIIVTIISSCTLVVVAIIQVTNAKTKKVEEERYKRRMQHEQLTMKLIKCDVKMSVLSAKKQSGENINGDLKIAIDKTEQAFCDYEEFACAEIASGVAKIR
jgi:energy-converting hydrogenase Eha subunit H